MRTAQKFDRRLRDYCNHLAYLPFQMGKERLDLDPELRSIAFEDYVLFMRYRNDRLEVVNIIEGHRDMPGYFSK